MYFSAFVAYSVLAAVGVLGEEWQLAQRTVPAEGAHATGTAEYSFDFNYGGAGNVPQTTQAPNIPFAELVKRQQDPTTICGLLATNTAFSWTCPSQWVCGFASTVSNFGCCSKYLGAGSVTGCYFPTACFDYSTARTMAACTGTRDNCYWSSKYCTNSARPYCGAWIEEGLTAMDCFSSPGLTYNLIPYTGTDGVVSTSLSGSASSTTTRRSSSITSSGPPPPSDLTSDRVPFTQQQQSVGSTRSSTSSSSTSTSSGGTPALGPTGEYLYGVLMSFVLLVL